MTPLDLPSALEECLFRMQRGETLDQVLVEYPEWVEDLRPLLEAAQYADTLRPAWRPSKEIQARSRAKFLNAAQGRTVKIPCREILNSRIPGLNWAAALVLAVFGIAILWTGIVSAQSLPGDRLYPLKLAAEQTRIRLTNSPANQIELEKEYDLERMEEVEALFYHQRFSEVDFAGIIQQTSKGGWEVGMIQLYLPENLPDAENLRPGYYVDVHGVPMEDGRVWVERIKLRMIRFNGRIEALQPSKWLIGGVWVNLTSKTIVEGSPITGKPVQVQAVRTDQETLEAISLQVGVLPFSIPLDFGLTRYRYSDGEGQEFVQEIHPPLEEDNSAADNEQDEVEQAKDEEQGDRDESSIEPAAEDGEDGEYSSQTTPSTQEAEQDDEHSSGEEWDSEDNSDSGDSQSEDDKDEDQDSDEEQDRKEDHD